MARKREYFEEPKENRLNEKQQDEVYEFFKNRDEEIAITAEDIDAVMRAEIAMYGNLNRYKRG